MWIRAMLGIAGSFAIGGVAFGIFDTSPVATIALALIAWAPWIVAAFRVHQAVGVVNDLTDIVFQGKDRNGGEG